MARWLIPLVLCLYANAATAQSGDLIDDYIRHWVEFYPSAAFNEGMHAAAQRFEDYSARRVADWTALNRRTAESLGALSAAASINDRVDARVLLRQVNLELELWERDRPLSHQPQWYAAQVSEALTRVLVSEKLTPEARLTAVRNRLKGIRELCRTGISRLTDGSPSQIARSLSLLENTIVFYAEKLPAELKALARPESTSGFAVEMDETTQLLRELVAHITSNVQPKASLPDTFGAERYSRKLALYSDGGLTPERLASLSSTEVDRVRGLMIELAKTWWSEHRAGEELPGDKEVLDAALAAMEEDRATHRAEFLRIFQNDTRQSIRFVIERDLATPPQNLEVTVDQLPDHSPFATIGVVLPPGPFDPEASTLLYLPSIPDDAPAERKEGFYRSFNNHFNRMIIAHEIFPGHDMQYKVGLEHASRVRALFSNPYLAEGWASFSEILMLDAGWGDGDRLTRLAHLRKRLENATRAYVSVMVHTAGWNRAQVTDFATRRGLLPPQFADNLWDRVSNPEMALQLTTYFAGFHDIRRLWRAERDRLGEAFDQKAFVDKLLRAGSVPPAVLDEVMRQQAGD